MVTLFEFLSSEAIDNVITCINYKVDKVIFFGYHDKIQQNRDILTEFLSQECKVSKTIFHELSHKNLKSMLATMRSVISNEIGSGNDIYFDISGGENVILVAFGILSREFDTPMHFFNLPEGNIVELDEGASNTFSSDVPSQKTQLSIENYVKLKGGVINFGLHKALKNIRDQEFSNDVDQLWQVSYKYKDYWNIFSTFIRGNLRPDESELLTVRADMGRVCHALNTDNCKLTKGKLLNIIDALAAAKLLKDVVHNDNFLAFRYKSDLIKSCVYDSGSVLELITYKKKLEENDQCMVGVHLDWDGVLHDKSGEDVCNEIDVMTINNGIPTFISCKAGHLNPNTILNALYELHTVANRFGGKYAKKKLVIVDETLPPIYKERAEEMGIEIVHHRP